MNTVKTTEILEKTNTRLVTIPSGKFCVRGFERLCTFLGHDISCGRDVCTLYERHLETGENPNYPYRCVDCKKDDKEGK